MNSQTIVICVVALILGMLLAHMLKSVCGCKVVEGACTSEKCIWDTHAAPITPGSRVTKCQVSGQQQGSYYLNNKCTEGGGGYLNLSHAGLGQRNNPGDVTTNTTSWRQTDCCINDDPVAATTTTTNDNASNASASATVDQSTIFPPRVSQTHGNAQPVPTATDYAAAEAAEAAEAAAQQLEDQRRFCECMDGQYSMGNRNLGSNNRRADLVCNAMMRQYGRPDGHVGKTLCGTANGETILF